MTGLETWWKFISFLVTWQMLLNVYCKFIWCWQRFTNFFFAISYLDSFTPSKTLKVLAFQWCFDFASLGKLCGNSLTVRLTPGTTGRNDTSRDAWGAWTWRGDLVMAIVLDLYVSDDRSGSSQKTPKIVMLKLVSKKLLVSEKESI